MARYAEYAPIYAACTDFFNRCLAGDRSLLAPGREVWTIANLEDVRRRFVEGFIQGRITFREKLESQLSGAPADAWALLADCFYLYGLPSRSMRFATKKGWVEWAAAQANLTLPPADDPIWQPLQEGFAPTGQKYNLKHAQLRLLVLLALEVKGSADRAAVLASPQALQDMLDGILESIPLKIDRANDMRNALLYMAFPDEYEPILSNQDKDAILRHYSAQAAPLPADRDASLRRVREHLTPRFTGLGRPFDFYLDAREEWRASSLARALAEEGAAEPAPHGLREPGAGWPTVAPAPDPDVARVLAALRFTRNVILSGPPGTGKTYLAGKAARALVAGQGAQPEDHIWWLTLHASYAYEDFVEGLRPVLSAPRESGSRTAPGRLGYEIRPGLFLEIAAQAAADPARTYVLVMDEINRGNLAKIFGELITLIEDERRGTASARLVYSGAPFSVPPNLVILGTMNTADRSIALLDAALRRRFAFIEIQPHPELLSGVTIETDEAALDLEALLRCLNAALLEPLGPDHLIGHSYLMRVAQAAPAERLSTLELVWNTQILPLLEEYFYARRDRLAEILAPFVDDGDLSAAAPIARLTGDDLIVALNRLCER